MLKLVVIQIVVTTLTDRFSFLLQFTVMCWDKVSGLKSILRVVLPASAGPKSDLKFDAVSGSDLILLDNHATSTASALPEASLPGGACHLLSLIPA